MAKVTHSKEEIYIDYDPEDSHDVKFAVEIARQAVDKLAADLELGISVDLRLRFYPE